MNSSTHHQDTETTTLGTIAWVGVVIAFAVVALLLLSWLGPVGGN